MPDNGLAHRVKRWMYRGGRPHLAARVANRAWAALSATGVVMPGRLATLAVRGRRTGRTVTLPVVIADHDGQRYLVSMLGADAGWVRNVLAADGRAVLRQGRSDDAVRLVTVPPAQRAPVLRRYLAVAPGARPHIPVDRHAPEAEFARIADRYPVFHITPDR